MTPVRSSAIVLSLCIILLTTAVFANCAVICVKTDGSDAGSGASWDLAKQTVQAGIDAASAGDEVWVKAGTYVESITLKDGVGLYGGFAGTETSRASRNWTTNVTILDGNQGGSVVTSPAGATSTTIIDGFTVRNGNGTIDPQIDWRCGGGIYCSSSSPTISNNTITGSSVSYGYGGGIFCSSSTAIISNNSVTGNTAYSGGGGIASFDSSPIVSGNTISGNTVTTRMMGGGGICCFSFTGVNGSPTISDNIITRNSLPMGGGGGGISLGGVSGSVAANTITYNTCQSVGGGIICGSGATTTISNNKIAYNEAGSNMGAGIAFHDDASTAIGNVINGNLGGGIECRSSAAVISGNTIAGNHSVGVIMNDSATTVLSNNIVAFNGSGLMGGTSPSWRNNCVFGNKDKNYDGTSVGQGDISVDPKFASMAYGNFHLQTDSPCVNAGYDDVVQPGWTDMDGQARIQGTHTDIGADESNGTWSSDPPRIVCVSPDGDNANDGSTWALAKKTVQAGIDVVSVVGGDVWIKAGVYNERVTVLPNCCLYGGFKGTESVRAQRDWNANVTVLDGQQGGAVIAMDRGCMGNVDGLTIRNGSATNGGGVYCGVPSIPGIYNNTITGNTATSGGGIYCDVQSQSSIAHNKIKGNTATDGGGIYATYASPVIAGNIMSGNTCSARGGGIYFDNSAGTTTNNTIVANTGTTGGGGIASSNSNPTLANNIVALNSSGVYKTGSATPLFRKNDVVLNTSYNYSGMTPGGPMYFMSLDPLFVDSANGDYHITSASPCKNAGYDSAVGIPATDMDGQGRKNGVVDMGADEFWVASMREAKNSADLTGVDMDRAIVTAAFPDFFYIESDNRACGIRVNKTGHSLEIGMRADVAGVLSMNSDGERCIDASDAHRSAWPNDSGSLNPLAISNQSLGGGAMGLQLGVYGWLTARDDTGHWTRVWGPVSGLNNIGLLITSWGKVSAIDSTSFSINDGSRSVRVVVPAGVTLPAAGAYVSVTGVSSCEKPGADILPLIRVCVQADIVTLKAP